MAHDSLQGHIHTNYHLMFNVGLNLDTIERMMPWERQIYVNLYIKEQQKKKEEYERHKLK
jgi:hypothetical protein|tara:strand:- start:1522 stop:1701 length:180 start_codon:yes stop_codon:yes gene_type:complete